MEVFILFASEFFWINDNALNITIFAGNGYLGERGAEGRKQKAEVGGAKGRKQKAEVIRNVVNTPPATGNKPA